MMDYLENFIKESIEDAKEIGKLRGILIHLHKNGNIPNYMIKNVEEALSIKNDTISIFDEGKLIQDEQIKIDRKIDVVNEWENLDRLKEDQARFDSQDEMR